MCKYVVFFSRYFSCEYIYVVRQHVMHLLGYSVTIGKIVISVCGVSVIAIVAMTISSEERLKNGVYILLFVLFVWPPGDW